MKVRYNSETGEMSKVYAENITIPEPFIILTQEEINNISNQADKVPFIIDGAVVLKDKATIEAKKEAIKEIEAKLVEADVAYNKVMNTAAIYTNGFTYKPTYVDSYALLIASGLSPLTIWDSTELNAVSMTTAELTTLTYFLKNIAEPAFQAHKATRKALLEQKTELEK